MFAVAVTVTAVVETVLVVRNVRERRRCVSCLPGRLGRCENYGVTSGSDESVFEKDSEDEPGTDDASEASDVAPSSGGECSPSFDANNSQGFDAVGESDGPSFCHPLT